MKNDHGEDRETSKVCEIYLLDSLSNAFCPIKPTFHLWYDTVPFKKTL